MKKSIWILLNSCLLICCCAQAASFNCANAHTKVEHLICDNPQLSDLDETLSAYYQAAIESQPQEISIKQDQTKWLKQRNVCSELNCVKISYERRIMDLSQSISTDQTVSANAKSFAGTWAVDLRSAQQRAENVDCGSSFFTLRQSDNRIEGEHFFGTIGCGRLDEGGERSIKGVVIGSTAVLMLTSGRNGAVFIGKAKRKSNQLHWEIQNQLTPGDPAGDSLIFSKGILVLESP